MLLQQGRIAGYGENKSIEIRAIHCLIPGLSGSGHHASWNYTLQWTKERKGDKMLTHDLKDLFPGF